MERSHAKYKRPTLVETFTELHLEPETLTEAHFFDVVPKLKELGFTEVEFATGGFRFEGAPGRPGFPRETQRIRCWRPGRRELAQVGEDLFVINLTGDYPGWTSFTQLFNECLEALGAGLRVLRIRSLNLVTIDRFQVPKDGFLVSDYLDVGGRVIPTWYADCRHSLDLSIGRGMLQVDGYNRQIQVSVQAAANPVSIAFQGTFHDVVRAGDNPQNMLEHLHRDAYDTFEALITDRVRNEIMGGTV